MFWVGTYDETVFAGLTHGWQRVLTALGLADWAQRVQQGTSHQVTTRSLPAMLTYGLLYTGACLTLIWLLTARRQALRTAVLIYGSVFAASALLLIGGKLAGDAQWAYQLGRRLIDFIVSPLPVIALVPLLRWQRPAAPQA
ncbi:hypothetical protein B0919_21500 [Hymenobacter sp. CRA2]|nr:hypothetical protein B0919_21500 [Hymenobacter sp. CRA2]